MPEMSESGFAPALNWSAWACEIEPRCSAPALTTPDGPTATPSGLRNQTLPVMAPFFSALTWPPMSNLLA